MDNHHYTSIEDPSILYPNTDDLLGHSMLTPFSEQKFDLFDSKADDVPFTFDGYNPLGIHEHYDDSGPSSIQFGEGVEASEHEGSHMHGNDGILNGNVRPGELHEVHGVAGLQLPSSTSRNIDLNGYHFLPSKLNGTVAKGSLVSKTVTMAVTKNTPTPVLDSITVRGSAITPESTSSPKPTPTRKRKISDISPKKAAVEEFRTKASIPEHLTWLEYARQGILAAYSSRLNPYALHPGEYNLLREHITRPQVTIYLNIRNGILRLWHRNPMVGVTRHEAVGCCKDSRYFALAQVAYDWLLRNGYINFGCVELPNTARSIPRSKAKGGRRRTIVVVGAGMSGLGCARQLESLIAQYGEKFTDDGERPPKIIVLEGRNRLGGRVYSHPFQKQVKGSLPAGMRCTVEMGAQIITGFEHGNPMNAIVRGQLGLPYHALRDNSVLYDYDGRMVDKRRDLMVERLYNDVLERAAVYRNKLPTVRTVQGDEQQIRLGLDPKEGTENDTQLISSLEEAGVEVTVTDGNPVSANKSNENAAAGVVKEGGRSYQLAGSSNRPAAEAARILGWQLVNGTSPEKTIDLTPTIDASQHPTLGETMDEGLRQYTDMLELSPEDLRLFNWHHANLEYANAANVNQLSLGGWDQDIGNEFEGEHTEIIGGYSQVPRALYQLPSQLDVRFKHAVKAVRYNTTASSPSGIPIVVECHNGEKIEADELVLTTPLGVLKDQAIKFNPPLPDWKTDCIKRMGFGLLNKVILTYDEVFWEEDRDMFGLLNTTNDPLDIKSYAQERGRFYLFWNRTKQSGRPTLVALMAGTAAYSVEESDNESLVQEATARLTKVFAPKRIPAPTEAIVTRWKRDPFARGSYSFVGPETISGDYDVMAKAVGSIHFAGEATCGTHPATVHGAYISGLRAASDVITKLLGRINVPSPLIERGPVKIKSETVLVDVPLFPGSKKQKGYVDIWEPVLPPPDPKAETTLEIEVETYEARIICAVFDELGDRPIRPEKSTANPYLMYQDDEWYNIKNRLQAQTGKKPSRNEVRIVLGAEWRNLAEEKKKPYTDRSNAQRSLQTQRMAEYNEKSRIWDQEAARIKRDIMLKDPPSHCVKEKLEGRSAIDFGGANRIGRKLSGYNESVKKEV